MLYEVFDDDGYTIGSVLQKRQGNWIAYETDDTVIGNFLTQEEAVEAVKSRDGGRVVEEILRYFGQ